MKKYYEDDLNDLLVIDERDDLIVQKFKELKTKPIKTLVFKYRSFRKIGRKI